MDTLSGFADSVRSSVCFQSLLGFFFNKGVRGGPRVLLNLAGVLVALFIFVKLVPLRMTENVLQSIPIPQRVWGSLPDEIDRIVVFGEIDIGTPVGADEEVKDSRTWTQALCDQLTCHTHVSMVPSPDAASWSVSSNDIYARGVEKVLNETAGKDGPGEDYSYLSTTYPPQWKSSDLRAQIDKFLAMPKPQSTPSSTLWVFSFGLWDVWSLSALPMNTGGETVGEMTKDMFEQIERLYEASMDPTSIAYSDARSRSFVQESSEETTENTEEAPAGEQLEARDEPEAEIQPPAEEAAEETPKPADSFSILIPRIMDPSLLPGWRELRPQIPSVHSKAEQMRNSAALTGAWNEGVVNALSDWVKKDDATDDAEEHRDDTAIPPATIPTRDGFAYNLADFVVDHMRERQMLSAQQTDGNGYGQSGLEKGYRDVQNPCLQPISTVGMSVSVDSDVTLGIPNVKIDNDKQAPTRPKKPAAVKRDYDADADRKEGLAYLAVARVCKIPGDHLFYTPFALSQRAIQEVAAETAEMVRSGESVRARLNSLDVDQQ